MSAGHATFTKSSVLCMMRFEGDLALLKASVKKVTLRLQPPFTEQPGIEAEQAGASTLASGPVPDSNSIVAPPPLAATSISHPYTPENGFEVLRDETIGGNLP